MGDGWSKYTTETATALTEAALAIIALQKAYNERAAYAGLTTLTEAKYLEALPSAFCPAYDNSLDIIIPRFGRIVNGAYVAYTLVSIYAELGETRLDSRAANYPFAGRWSQEWLEQVIRVINKLLIVAPIQWRFLEASWTVSAWSQTADWTPTTTQYNQSGVNIVDITALQSIVSANISATMYACRVDKMSITALTIIGHRSYAYPAWKDLIVGTLYEYELRTTGVLGARNQWSQYAPYDTRLIRNTPVVLESGEFVFDGDDLNITLQDIGDMSYLPPPVILEAGAPPVPSFEITTAAENGYQTMDTRVYVREFREEPEFIFISGS